MSPVSAFLLVVAAVFLVGVVGEWAFGKTGVPDVVWLIVVGIVIGPATGLVARDSLAAIAPFFGALTLVVVLFEGGSRLALRDLSGAAFRSSLLAVLSFTCSVAAVAMATMGASWLGFLPEGWTWIHGITTGAIVGGSSSVVVMPAMKQAGLSPRIAHLVGLESAFTDVLCVVGTVACIRIGTTGASDWGSIASSLGHSFGIGLGAGLACGFMGLLFLRMLRDTAYAYPLTLGALLILYVLVDETGGSAALAILTVAVVLGNATSVRDALGLSKDVQLGEGVRAVHSQLTFIIKSFFFTFIGAMLMASWALLLLGATLGLALLLARVPAVRAALIGADVSRGARGVVVVTLPRGMAAGVLAMFPSQAGMQHTEQLPVLVFATVLASILIFALGFPLMRRQLGDGDLEASPGSPRPPDTAERASIEVAVQTSGSDAGHGT